ncbi:hypothetical protein C0J52_06422, partial [Blattella germanica]
VSTLTCRLRFSSGQNRLLQKLSLLPWNHGVDVVKNVYVCREITLRSNASFIVFGGRTKRSIKTRQMKYMSSCQLGHIDKPSKVEHMLLQGEH